MLNEDLIAHFWSIDQETLFKRTGSGLPGLSENEANVRLSRQRKANKTVQPWRRDAKLLLAQYKNPLVLLLIFAVFLSLILKEYSDGIIVLIVLLSTGIFGFFQERNAGRAVEKLRALVHSKVRVRRGGKEEDIPADEVVTGDIVLLSAGCMIPSDALILESNNLHVNESILTGEAFPVEKNSGTCKPDAALSAVGNSVFKGSSVVSGSAVVLTANAGKYTELGKIASSLESEMSANAFEIGIMKFGYLLMRLTIIATGAILIFNIILHKPFIDSILFALALAIGLTPELLPVITTITLSAGAKRMAAKKVIVKKLSAIQNLGEIDILCSDKTGTITEGAVQIESVIDLNGNRSDKALLYAYLNAYFETGFSNPMDDAIRQVKEVDITGYTKYDELPYDFIRKRLSVAVSFGDEQLLITKGAVDNILQVCSFCEKAGANQCTIEEVKDALKQQFAALSGNGFRVIGVCYKNITGTTHIGKDDEKDMVFLGFIVLYDPPKKGIVESITALRNTGIALKVITGDNRLAAKHIASAMQLSPDKIVTSTDLANLTDEALQQKALDTDIFVEIIPAEKERIVKALQKAGHAVGYLGDGINDANALKAADVGISVDTAVEVAKEAADLVLLDKDIDVLREGVLEGRKTFMNTLKYLFVATSTNFGCMLSMAIASLLLPFLPLLPVQVLLNNFLSDFPFISISSDNVDDELVAKPRTWDIRYIKRFMMVFGTLSSMFDFLTFFVLLFVFHSSPAQFRSAWFLESLLTQALIVLIIRTRRPFIKSKPSKYLLLTAVCCCIITFLIPYLPVGKFFSLYPLPVHIIIADLVIVAIYILLAETSKRYLMQRL